MSDERRKRDSGPWMAMGILLPVLYLASFGPAAWISSRLNFGARLVPIVYGPILRVTFPDVT